MAKQYNIYIERGSQNLLEMTVKPYFPSYTLVEARGNPYLGRKDDDSWIIILLDPDPQDVENVVRDLKLVYNQELVVVTSHDITIEFI